MNTLFKSLKLFKRRKKNDLRQACLEKYGEEFIRLYDALASGKAIGDLAFTTSVVVMIEAARKELDDGTA